MLKTVNEKQEKLIQNAGMVADQKLSEWLHENAPAEIVELYDNQLGLTIIKSGSYYCGYTESGLNAAVDSADRIVNIIADTII